MKHYLATILERHGEFECSINYLFSTKLDPNTVSDACVRSWYDIELNEDPHQEGVYWNDCMTYECGGVSEIKKSTYDDIKNKQSIVELHKAEDDKYIFVYGEDKND